MPAELQSSPSSCKVRIAAGGIHRSKTFESVAVAISNLEKAKFNEVEFTYSIGPKRHFRLSGSPVRIVGVLKPSVTSDLWFKTSDWPADTGRESGLRRINTQAAEAAPGAFGISRMPTAFEFFVELKSRDSSDEILDDFAEWIVHCIPQALTSLDVFGCVDGGGPEFFVKFHANVLMTDQIRLLRNVSPTFYPKLGRAFDALHPILFGSEKALQPIAAALGGCARLLLSERNTSWAAIRLDSNCDLEDANRRVAEWMLKERSFKDLEALTKKQDKEVSKMRREYARRTAK